jgi:hypothetical protein
MKNSKQKGFITTIIIIIVALILAKYYFHFDVSKFVDSEKGKEIITGAKNLCVGFYNWADSVVRYILIK